MKTKECPSCAMDIDRKSKVCPICNYEFASKGPVRWTAILLFVLFVLYLILGR